MMDLQPYIQSLAAAPNGGPPEPARQVSGDVRLRGSNESYQLGFECGKGKGYTAGWNDGWSKGWNKGKQAGFQKWEMLAGLTRGRHKGKGKAKDDGWEVVGKGK